MSLLGNQMLGRKVIWSELYEGLWGHTVRFRHVRLIHWVWVQIKLQNLELTFHCLSAEGVIDPCLFIGPSHHTVIIDGVAKYSPQSTHPCVGVCLPQVNRFQLPFFPPPLLLDTVSFHPYPCHDMELFDRHYITMRNDSISLWNVATWKWDQEREATKEEEQEDRFWKMQEDFSEGQTLCERRHF